MEKKIFISHSKLDKKIAHQICNALEAEELGCWIAPRDIPYGHDWAGEITKAIKASSLFVLLLSENSNISTQCPKEVNIADNANVPILCINIDDSTMSPGYEYHLSLKQTLYLDVSMINKQIQEIVSAVKSEISSCNSTSNFSDYSHPTNKNPKKDFSKSEKSDRYPLSSTDLLLIIVFLLITVLLLLAFLSKKFQLNISFLPDWVKKFINSNTEKNFILRI